MSALINSFPRGISLLAKGQQKGDVIIDGPSLREYSIEALELSGASTTLSTDQVKADGVSMTVSGTPGDKTLSFPLGSQIISALELKVGESKELHLHMNGDLGDNAGTPYLLSVNKQGGDATLLTDETSTARVMESYSKTTLTIVRETETAVRVL